MVELALCIPVLMLLTLGAVETTNLVFLKQALTEAAYEGVRDAIEPGSQAHNPTGRANQVLGQFKVKNATVTVTPSDVVNATRGTKITVQVSAPTSPNTVGTNWFFAGSTIKASITMVKE